MTRQQVSRNAPIRFQTFFKIVIDSPNFQILESIAVPPQTVVPREQGDISSSPPSSKFDILLIFLICC